MSDSVLTHQLDENGNMSPQNSTDNAAHVHVNSGAVGIDPSVPGITNGVVLTPAFVANSSVLNSSSVAYVSSQIIKQTTCKLFGMTGFSSRGTAQFIQIHDSASLPAEGAIPKIVFFVAATANFSIDFGTYGRLFQNGVVICNSSTAPTKTIGSADCWFDIQYL